MSLYDKVVIIMPNSTICIDPEMTLKNYIDTTFEKIQKGEPLLFRNEHGCVIYTHDKGLPISILTEKEYNNIRREIQMQQALQGRGIIPKG